MKPPLICLQRCAQFHHETPISRLASVPPIPIRALATPPGSSQRAPSRVPALRAQFTSSIRRQNLIPTERLSLPDLPTPVQPPSSSPSTQHGEEPPDFPTPETSATFEPSEPSELSESSESDPDVRLPRSVQAIYLRPLRRRPKYGLPCCDLQLRSYSVRNLEFFADFAMRAAYYLHLPASGPVPLPRIIERWTVPRSSFVHKKSQENFERITMRRLVQILDGNVETVGLWLAFLRKHAYYGVGMKANVWEYEKLGVGKTMDTNLSNLKQTLEPNWAHFGRRKNLETSEKVFEMLKSSEFQRGATAG